jgi:serine/threonine protein kinase
MSSDHEEVFDLNADCKNFKEILKSSSSIEALLDEKDIKKWRIPLEHLKFGHTLGRGAFGVVVYGRLKRSFRARSAISCADSGLDTSGSYYMPSSNSDLNYVDVVNTEECGIKEESRELISVAIKKLPEAATAKNYYDLFKELNLMFHVGQHKHIVSLIGYCIENTSLYIIIDYAKHGNLKEFLRKHQTENTLDLIGTERLLLYSHQIALGMQYLHSKKVILFKNLAS